MKIVLIFLVSALCFSACGEDTHNKNEAQQVERDKLNKDIMKITPTPRPNPTDYKNSY